MKRAFDLVGAVALLIVLSPVLALCALVVKLDSRGPVFFRQQRLGLNATTFPIWKFRTMVVGADKLEPPEGHHKDDWFVTRSGRFMRKHHVDELPQLFNVVHGEMSLVGPRPLLPRFLSGYSEGDRRRMLVLPGMTGWQQVVGSSSDTWEERVALDVWYVDNWTLWLDLTILFRTVYVVLFKTRGAYGEDGRQICGVPTAFRTGTADQANSAPGGSAKGGTR
jgi:lipopolysaccharide/colanic/teichoic acid biosynthesis glycosyltransferase